MSLKKSVFIVKSEFNRSLVEELYESALRGFKASLQKQSQNSEQDQSHQQAQNQEEFDLKSFWAPGAGEIPQAIQWILNQDSKKAPLAESVQSSVAGVLALGVIIRGKTPHFDFLKDFLQTALWDLQKSSSVPLVFSVLMLENRDQFKDRVIRANEAMKALLKMIHLKQTFSKNS